ncbi:MAG: sulfite exporter TauE/SafE family protein [Endomicrobia bacterium]|nr:sulfite exporter TauE/SafE family protein [Endomicrobiia bacterium]MCX7941355.1 sulfite exporter TauE/SafE family protein [Endomicrobiia bacterium]MDW8055568.1 sulfite exporter TauE/SafE family protein [Elusimicrobiota bacterium]
MFNFLILGIIAGIFGGILGIGGGTIIIPALVYLFGFTQHQAQGVSLVLIALPVGLLAAINYYRHGNLLLKPGLLIALGFLFGGFIGAEIAHKIPESILRKIFGIFLIIVALRMIFWK